MNRRSPPRLRPAPLLDLMKAPATDISRLESLLNWRLLKGSHKFPEGLSGGTCILEAAVVVSGLPYRVVVRSIDVPAGFSLIMSEYLLRLNDALPDEPRQDLIRFVPRLAGSFDRIDIEERRMAFIVSETRKHVLPVARRLGWKEKRPPADMWGADLGWAAKAAGFPWTCSGAAADARAVLAHALEIAEAAFDIGWSAKSVDPLTALVRLEAVRPQPPRRIVQALPEADGPLSEEEKARLKEGLAKAIPGWKAIRRALGDKVPVPGL